MYSIHKVNARRTNSSPYLREASEIIRKARLSAGMSQSSFAAALGRSQALVSKYESGKTVPPADLLIHCMHIAGATVTFGDSGSSASPHWAPVYESLRDLAAAIRAAEQSSVRGP